MKNIKKAYCFDDLALIPKYSEVRSRLDVNIETNLTNKTKINNQRAQTIL